MVVTYNRKLLLKRNLESLFSQKQPIEQVVVVDNHSTDETVSFIKQSFEANKEKLTILELPENRGGSGGFHEGTKFAFDAGYDLVWLMDDDGYAYSPDTLKELVSFCSKKQLLGSPFIVNSLVICDQDRLSFGLIQNGTVVLTVGELKGDSCSSISPFNGTLVSKEVFEKIGFPVGDFFIKGDEEEYTLRAKANNITVLTCYKSLFYHPCMAKTDEVKTILGIRFYNNIEEPWKEYYRMRNHCLNFQKYSKHPFVSILRFYIKRRLSLFVFPPKKRRETAKAIKTGFKHAKQGKTGIYYLPGNIVKNE